jgi:hypothetical protein
VSTERVRDMGKEHLLFLEAINCMLFHYLLWADYIIITMTQDDLESNSS